MRPKLILVFFFVGAIFFLSACESRVNNPNKIDENSTNLTRKNLETISKIKLDDPYRFSFAIVSDSHTDYGDLKDMIKDINQKAEASFLIHAGDFTYLGRSTEFQNANSILKELNIPYLTVIGNHEWLSNGRQFCKEMFGDFNYSFVFGDYKFVFLDANSQANLGEPPILNWLEDQLSGPDRYNLVFVIVHQPPFDPAWSDETENSYRELMAENKVSLSIHGHLHYYWYGERYDDGVKYLVEDNAGDRNYCLVSVDSAAFDVENINIDK